MIARATDDDRPADVIVVHCFSRFFRDALAEMYIRRLAKAGVRLVLAAGHTSKISIILRWGLYHPMVSRKIISG